MLYMDEYHFDLLYVKLEASYMTLEQMRSLYDLLSRRIKKVDGSRKTGIHLDYNTAKKLDDMIIEGRSQRECCGACNVSTTTFKRHRKDLMECGLYVPFEKDKKKYAEKQIKAEEAFKRQKEKEIGEFFRYKDHRQNRLLDYREENGVIFAEDIKWK